MVTVSYGINYLLRKTIVVQKLIILGINTLSTGVHAGVTSTTMTANSKHLKFEGEHSRSDTLAPLLVIIL